MGVDVPSRIPERPGDPVARYQNWVTGFLRLLFLGGFALAVVGLNQSTHGAVILVGSVMGMVILGMVLLALDSRRPWAVDAATRICWIVIVLGILRTLVDLSYGRLNLPLDVIAAIAVLSRRPTAEALPTLVSGDRGTAILVAAGFFAASSLSVVAALLQGPTVR